MTVFQYNTLVFPILIYSNLVFVQEMAKIKRDIIALKCTKCGSKNYTLFKTKNVKDKLELKKFCGVCGEHTAHKETKVK